MKICDVLPGKNGIDLFILHEYKSSVEMDADLAAKFNRMGFNVIRCEYPGHGRRLLEGSGSQWKGVVQEVERAIKERGNRTFLFGTSMGGAIAITIGSRNPGIKKVFAVSAPNRVADISKIASKDVVDRVDAVMPVSTAKCRTSNRDRFFLIHSKTDPVVPMSEFRRNVDQLCLPEENALVLGSMTGIGVIDHVAAKYHRGTIALVRKNA
jgi:esterase/lipase